MPFDVPAAIKSVADLFDSAIHAAFPTPEAKASAEALRIRAASEAALGVMQAQMAIPLAEAQSPSFFTSGARPGFMWTMYALILWGIPFSIMCYFNPDGAKVMAEGFKFWLASIPDEMWDTLKVCFTVYALGRTTDKGIDAWRKK